MLGLRTVITVSILAIVIFAHSDSDEHIIDQHPKARGPTLCNHDPTKPSRLPPCSGILEGLTTSTTTEEDSSEEQTTLLNDVEDSNNDITALERAHWCRFSNGTYVPFNLEFYHTPCTLCHCTKSRSFHCQALQCMPTYCIDNARPVRGDGQCCTRCASDSLLNSSCVYNGTTYPHGVILKAIPGEMQCWCQLGNVECRQYIGTMFDGFNLMGQGVVYIILIAIFMIFFLGLLMCCGCTVLIYAYYQRNQQTFQEAYDQYVNSAGWQPMEEEEVAVDSIAEEKRLEAERNQFYNGNQDVIPPPYDVYNVAHVSGQEQK